MTSMEIYGHHFIRKPFWWQSQLISTARFFQTQHNHSRIDKIDICKTFSACNSLNCNTKFVIYLHRMFSEKKDHKKIKLQNVTVAKCELLLHKMKIFIWQRNQLIVHMNEKKTWWNDIIERLAVHFNIKLMSILWVCMCVTSK